MFSALRDPEYEISRAARPEERIILNARKAGEIGGLWMFDVRAEVDGKLVAVGQIVLNETSKSEHGRTGF